MGSVEVHKALVYDKPGTISTKTEEIDTPEPGVGEPVSGLRRFSRSKLTHSCTQYPLWRLPFGHECDDPIGTPVALLPRRGLVLPLKSALSSNFRYSSTDICSGAGCQLLLHQVRLVAMKALAK
jgi:hypothetical protein